MLDAEAYLDRCLAALASQSYPSDRYEVIIVDNGSTDRSLEIAKSHAGVKVLSEPRRGPYNARNRGIAASRGETLAFTDADCVADADWLSEIAGAMEDRSVELICGRRVPARRTWPIASLADYEATKDAFVLDGNREEIVYGYAGNMGVRREVFDSLGEFIDRPRGSDAMFAQTVARERSCRAIRFAPRAIVTHLEIDNLPTYFQKVFIYSRHRARNKAIITWRSLSFSERMQVFHETRKRGGYSPLRSAGLLGLLGFGLVAWWLGSTSARVR